MLRQSCFSRLQDHVHAREVSRIEQILSSRASPESLAEQPDEVNFHVIFGCLFGSPCIALGDILAAICLPSCSCGRQEIAFRQPECRLMASTYDKQSQRRSPVHWSRGTMISESPEGINLRFRSLLQAPIAKIQSQ
jgi:hypothetical protein